MGAVAGAWTGSRSSAGRRGQARTAGQVAREPIIWIGAVGALAFGLLMVGASGEFTIRAYGALRPNLAWMGIGFFASGLIIATVGLGIAGRRASILLLAVGQLPFATLSWLFLQTASVSGTVVYASLTVALLLVAAETAMGRRSRYRPLRLTAGATLLVTGGVMAADPAAFTGMLLGRLGDALPLVGIAELAAGAALLLTADRQQVARGRWSALASAVVFAPTILLAAETHTWTAVVIYGALAFALLTDAFGAERRSWILIGLGVAGALGAFDLAAAALAEQVDVNAWSRMTPEVSVLVLMLAVAFGLETLGHGVVLRRVLYGVALAGGVWFLVAALGRPMVSEAALTGRDVTAAGSGALSSAGIALVLLGAGGLGLAMRQRMWSRHVIAAMGTVVMAATLLNVFAYVADVPFLVSSYGLLAMRIHATLPFAALGGALLACVSPAIIRGPIAGRVFGALGLLLLGEAILGLYAAAAGGGLLAVLERDPVDARAFAIGAVAVSMAMILVFLSALFALGVLFTRTVTRPLDALAAAMARFSDGDRESRATAEGDDEVANAARVFNDTADRLAASESAVRQLNIELEGRVVERTAELASATQELEAFAYSVSHDLRAPLRAIDGFATIVRDEDAARLSETGRRYLEKVQAASAEMSALIDDLLRLSLVTRAEMHRERVDVTALTREVLARHADERTECLVADGLTAEADPGLLRTAIENLVSNAVKFTRRAPRPRIEVGRDIRTGELYVRDNGVGFDMMHADRLFEPFQRLHAKEDFEGTGIGLATVRRVARRHGGSVRAEAAPGSGASFYLTLDGAT